METFKVSINGREAVDVNTKSTFYYAAVLASFAHMTHDDIEKRYAHVRIWVPHLLPTYGPYDYTLYMDEYGLWRYVNGAPKVTLVGGVKC